MEPLITRIDHVSLAVRDYDKALDFFGKICGLLPGVSREDRAMKFIWQLFSMGDLSRFELMRATGEGSFLDKFLANREGGVHHITLQTPDIEVAKEVLNRNGIPFFGYEEYTDAYWKALYIHPRHAFGVLIQIAEFNAPDWLNEQAKLPDGKRWSIERSGAGLFVHLAHPGGGRFKMELSKDEAKKLMADLQASIEARL